MTGFNEFFKGIATKMGLPEFFEGSTLFVNNLFLVLLGVLLAIVLILVIVLVPGKKKLKNNELAEAQEEVAPSADEAQESDDNLEEMEAAPAKEEPTEQAVEPVTKTPAEEAPAEEPVQDLVEEEKELVIETAGETEPQSDASEEVLAAAESADEPAQKASGKYEIVCRAGSYYFLLKANNGQLLMESSGYTSEQGVKKAIETFKNAAEVGEFRIDEDKNGNFKFVLRASARSQMLYYGESYSTKQSAMNAIQSVKNFAPKAEIKRVAENDTEGDASETGTLLETPPMTAADYKVGGKYEIEERNGSYYFLLKANNGQLLLESPAFTTEQGAKSGIESFKKAADTGIFMINEDKNGNFKFILRASARSQMRYSGESYSTKQSAENSVASVRAFAKKAVLKK